MTISNTTPNSKQRTGTPGAHPLPPAWEPKDSTVNRLAKEVGVSPAALLDGVLAAFRRISRKRDFLYRNWDAAFSNCVRKNWAGIRTAAGGAA